MRPLPQRRWIQKGLSNEDGLRLGVAPDNVKGLATRTKKPTDLKGRVDWLKTIELGIIDSEKFHLGAVP